MAWFCEDDYEAFRSALPSRAWHATFAEWESAAEKNVERLRNQGVRAVKAKARSVDFMAWRKATGRNVDTKALTDFAAEAAHRELTGRHGEPHSGWHTHYILGRARFADWRHASRAAVHRGHDSHLQACVRRASNGFGMLLGAILPVPRISP